MTLDEKKEKLFEIVKSFINFHDIRCDEQIYQTDEIIENAYYFIHRLCDVVGYSEGGESE